MRILVTGGCGYKGHVLVPKLLDEGHFVRVLDLAWFGNYHTLHPNLSIEKQDIRDLKQSTFEDVDLVIHLASIANDPCGDLNPKLTWETSCLATMQLADFAVRAGVQRIIYASSGSVYGVKSEELVTEDLILEPLSEYNKTKMVSERVLLSFADKIGIQIVRPATVCGLSARMRLDVSVNLLTMQALQHGVLTVFGGSQIRPNIHIDDITDLYVYLIQQPELTGIFNAGFENLSILDIAKEVQKSLGCEIDITPSNDPRSYRLDSSKLLKTGFTPKKGVANAITEIADAYNSGMLEDKTKFHNLAWMKEQGLAERF